MGEGDKDNDVDGDHGGGPPPTQQSAMSEEKTITDLVLGVGNWWCLKQGKDEVVILVKRHFGNEEVFQSNLVLAAKCDLDRPIKLKVSVSRPAIDAFADDLVTNKKNLINSVKLPIIVIPATQLGRVPLDALSIGDERSVGARWQVLCNV